MKPVKSDRKLISRRLFVTHCLGGLCTLAARATHAQEAIEADLLQFACNFHDAVRPKGAIWTFKSSDEARKIVEDITSVIGLNPNFEIRAADIADAGRVANASAWVDKGKRYIVYSEAWVQAMLRDTKTYWAGIALLAHECAHHLHGDTINSAQAGHAAELSADRFAGFAVGRLGGSLLEAQALFQGLSPQGSQTHPPRSARVEAATVGWRQAQNSPIRPPKCEPGWRGSEFTAQGSTCREVQTCEGGAPRIRTACKDQQGDWFWTD